MQAAQRNNRQRTGRDHAFSDRGISRFDLESDLSRVRERPNVSDDSSRVRGKAVRAELNGDVDSADERASWNFGKAANELESILGSLPI